VRGDNKPSQGVILWQGGWLELLVATEFEGNAVRFAWVLWELAEALHIAMMPESGVCLQRSHRSADWAI